MLSWMLEWRFLWPGIVHLGTTLIALEKACREEQDLEALYVAGLGVEPGDDVVTQLLGFLLWVRGATGDVEDVALAVVLKG